MFSAVLYVTCTGKRTNIVVYLCCCFSMFIMNYVQPGIALFRPDSARTYTFYCARETLRMIVNDSNIKPHTSKNLT